MDDRCILKTTKIEIFLVLFWICKLYWDKPIITIAEKTFLHPIFSMPLGSLMETLLSITPVEGRSAGCRHNLKRILESSWTASDSLGCCQMLRTWFVCISYECEMIYLDLQKCVDNFGSYLLQCCLFVFFSVFFIIIIFTLVSSGTNTTIKNQLRSIQCTLSGLIYILLVRLLKTYLQQVQLFVKNHCQNMSTIKKDCILKIDFS